MTEVNTNLQIWDKVQRTDPKRTKPFKGAGGFSGTAINATYLAQRATEVFGPMGLGWGMNIIEEKILDFGDDKIHSLRGELWYVLDGKRGAIQHFGQTKICGKNKHGAFVDEDAPKKSLTDVMSKCLSLLGFGADVHLGLYDDNRYVTHITNQIADERRAAREEAQVAKAEPERQTMSVGASQDSLGNAHEVTDFPDQSPTNVVPLKGKKAEPAHDPETGEVKPLDLDAEMSLYDILKGRLDACQTSKQVLTYMTSNDTKADLIRLGKESEEKFREYARDLLAKYRIAENAAAAAAVPAE